MFMKRGEFQIFKTIVVFNPVFMVHNLSPFEWAAKMFGHDETMLKNRKVIT